MLVGVEAEASAMKISDCMEPRIQLPPSIYLDGCAWGCGFYIGAQSVFEEMWGSDFGTRTVIQGDSAGSLIATAWALGMSASFVQSVYANLAQCGPKEMMKLRLSDYHDAAIDMILDHHSDAHLKLRGRLQIGVTLFPRKHVWISEWRDVAHLRQTLHSSMHIPIYCREVPRLDGHAVVDGGISMGGRHLAHGDQTLVVSAAPWTTLPGEHFFDLSVFLWPSQCLFPPFDEKGVSDLFELGVKVAREWFNDGAEKREKKRRSRVFKYGGALVCIGMWGARSIGEHALPLRTRRPPLSARL